MKLFLLNTQTSHTSPQVCDLKLLFFTLLLLTNYILIDISSLQILNLNYSNVKGTYIYLCSTPNPLFWCQVSWSILVTLMLESSINSMVGDFL